MKQLSEWKLNKYNEIDYIKRFVNGVSKKELNKMFGKPMLKGLLTTLIGVELLKKQLEFNKEFLKERNLI